MHKSLFLSVLLAFSTLTVGANAAAPARGNARGGAATVGNSAAATSAAPVAARAGARQKVVGSAPATTAAKPSANGGVAARAGKKQTVAAAPKTSAAPAGKPMAARAGATQKVLQQGTKVATATTNSSVPQECQDAFYGCMDSFCMMDNASGGRCQCSDRVTELDKTLEEILKLDERIYVMANEGVERIQMGEAADEIMARAKAAADKVSVKDGEVSGSSNVAATNKKKTLKSLDLSAFNTSSIFSDDDEEDVFGNADNSSDLVDTFADKKGDELYKSAAKMCVKIVPDQCKQYGQMVQLVYAQRIKSDCTAYENSLKQQKSASQQKLLAAEKALRDAAFDAYQDENKYSTEGECVAAFNSCMQTTGGCGSDYTSCIADDTILTMGTDGSKGAATSASVKTSASAIDISANTLAILTDKAPLCESVLKQCKNVRNGVWTSYLKMIVPTLKSAEVLAEQNRRMNCIGNIVDCFSNACAAQWPNQESAEYDMCLSNPDIVSNLCQTQINKCSTAGTGEQVMQYVKAKLQSMRVDACTKQVKDCLLSDDRCGKDYAGCVGLDTDTIMDLCPAQKLTACQDKYNSDANSVRAYVSEIAQGLALNIDNSFAQSCQKAAEDSMVKVCGDKESCAGFALNADVGVSTLTYRVCPIIMDSATGARSMNIDKDVCRDSVDLISKEEFGLDKLSSTDVRQLAGIESGSSSSSSAWGFLFIVGGGSSSSASQSKVSYISKSKYTLKPSERVMWAPYMAGKIDWNVDITMDEDENGNIVFKNKATKPADYDSSMDSKNTFDSIDTIVGSLNNSLKAIMGAIEADPVVEQCMRGRSFQGISDATNKTDAEGKIIGVNKGTNASMSRGGRDALGTSNDASVGRFKNLTASLRRIAAAQVYNSAMANYNNRLAELQNKFDADALKISSKYDEVLSENNETALDQRLATSCNALNADNSTWNYKETIKASYNESNNTCIKTVRTQTCKTTTNESEPGRRTCREWNEAKEQTIPVQM